MLTLSSKRPPRATRRTSGEGLAVVWLHGVFCAVCAATGRSWISPEPAQDPDAVGRALLQAAASLQPAGRSLRMAVAHAKLRHQHLDLPPMRPGFRRRYLERQISRIPGIEGPHCWSSRPAVPITGPEAVLLSLLPRSLHDELVRVCACAGFAIQQLLPFSELLLASLRAADCDDPVDGFQLAAAPIAGRIEMAAAHRDGRALLARSSGPRAADAPDDGGTEVLRTAQFVQQTFSHPIERLHWIGPGPVPAFSAIKRPAEDAWLPRAWAERLLEWNPRSDGNLLSRDQREAAGRRVVQASHRALALLGVLGAGAFLVFADQSARRHGSDQRRLQIQMARLAEREQALRQEILRFEEQREIAAFVAPSLPPMPLWLLAALTEIIPQSFQVTEFEVRRDSGRWNYRIAGRDRAGAGVASVRVAEMGATLAGAPYFAQTAKSAAQPAASAPSTNWTQLLRDRLAKPRSEPATFRLEGHLE